MSNLISGGGRPRQILRLVQFASAAHEKFIGLGQGTTGLLGPAQCNVFCGGRGQLRHHRPERRRQKYAAADDRRRAAAERRQPEGKWQGGGAAGTGQRLPSGIYRSGEYFSPWRPAWAFLAEKMAELYERDCPNSLRLANLLTSRSNTTPAACLSAWPLPWRPRCRVGTAADRRGAGGRRRVFPPEML